jgi:hypothetical protein
MNRGYGKVHVKIERFLMLESNLLAFPRALGSLRLLRLALTIRAAAGLSAGPHKELFARDAATPHNSGQQQ